MIKRMFDVFFSLLGIIFLSPLFLIIAFLIKKEDRGPIFYRGVRVGKDGREFRMFKFRTMVVNAEKIGGPSTAGDDPRLTKIGKFIRKYNLDELPQFINVLKGEMSIVGPRPEVQEYVKLFTEKEKDILSLRPGITDWACIWNPDEGAILAGAEDPEKVYMEKIWPQKHKLELEYVRNHSIWVDFKIMFMTLKVHLLDPLKDALVRRCH